MSKLHEVTRDGVLLGWLIHCPACGHGHMLDARWTFSGDREHPTFTPSLLVSIKGNPDAPIPTKDYVCHSWVKGGRIEFLADSTHALAGRTVELEDFDVLRQDETEKGAAT